MKTFLSKQLAGLRLWWFLIPLGIAIVFLLIGTFNDLAISKTIVDQSNWFGVFIEGWGMFFPFAVVTLGGAAVGAGFSHAVRKRFRVLGYVLFILAIGLMTYFYYHSHISKIESGSRWLFDMGTGGVILGLAISLVMMSAVGIAGFFLFKKADPELAIRVGLFILIFAAVQTASQELLKMACYRPRFRYIAGVSYDADGNPHVATPEMINLFRNWYENWQWFRKSGYPDLPTSDCIKSFPSGHTGMGAAILLSPALLPLFGLDEKKLKLWQPIVFGIALIYLLLIASARVRVGAHWCSDVSFAIILASLINICLILIHDKIKVGSKKEQAA